ncbi:MAG TPA: sterol desaturase family protein [Vitreimonas sp.]|uniref:sterol desaturase family protein n=1 Tax=Vitreimonas sp. TaxID=3069702 RepID=UPI002D2F71A0|nr:sterol desaturase family protein [Vitreimonas sp.]HYD89674.1 sterol desaturase family protein [Vitreimonas sp.]
MTFADLYAFAGQWLESMATDLSRYVIFAVSVWLALWVVFAKVLAGRKIRTATPPARQLRTEFAISLRSLAIFSTIGALLFMVERAGYLPGPALAASWGLGWSAVSLLLMIVAHDAYFYWTHRAIHDPRLFRLFHLRHHRSNNPSPFTAYSFDLAEAALQASFVPLWMVAVPTQWEIVGLFMLHQIARNTFGHSGYELYPARRDGRPLFDFMTTTTHHDIHHAEAGWNYGLYFTWWDRLMGTEHPDYYARFAAATRKTCPIRQRAPAKLAATLFALLVVGGVAGSARAAAAPDVGGDWATRGLGGVVRLHPCAADPSLLCGRLLWVWDPAEVRRGAVGALILRDFRWDGEAWRGGAVLNPEDGRTYSGSIRLDGEVLRLRGCAGPFCQSQAWRRLASIPRPGELR